MIHRHACIAVLMLLLTSALDANTAVPLPAERVAPGAFEQLLVEVRRDLAPGGRYADLDADRRGALEGALSDMQTLLGSVASLDRLSPDAQLALVNAYHRANAALAEGDFDPIVCRRLIPTGSRVREVSCAHDSGLRERARIEQEAAVNAVSRRPR